MAERFKLTLKLGNEAFSDDPSYEVARILREAAKRVERGDTESVLMDVNGNKVGEFVID